VRKLKQNQQADKNFRDVERFTVAAQYPLLLKLATRTFCRHPRLPAEQFSMIFDDIQNHKLS
jgi:hypothetical protein